MENNNVAPNIARLIISVVLCQLVGLAGAFFTMPAIDNWYSTLNKPFFNLPNWVFAPVWTILFLLMGVALFFVWKDKSKNGEKKTAIAVFFAQLILNILWSVLFFALESPLAAFLELMALWIMVLFTIATFYKISKIAAWLMIPYILWVTFAGFLNFVILWLN